jgi:hypothetical protein
MTVVKARDVNVGHPRRARVHQEAGMSKVAICGTTVGVLLALGAGGWAQVDVTRPFEPDADTVALFHLDDAATGTVTDASGGPAGALGGAVATLGRFGGGISLDGLGGWVDVRQPRSAAGGTGLTVECWVKFRRGARADVICRNMAYMLRLDGAIHAYVTIDGAWRKVIGRRPVPTGRWTHLAMTYDRRSKEVRTYVDGRLDTAQVPDGVTDGVLGVGDDVLRLGANNWSPESSVLDGKLDEVRISSVARTYAPLSAGTPAAVPPDTNLLPNPSFEFGLSGWRANGEANTQLQWHAETAGAPQGRAFLRSTEPGGYSLISHPITIAPGKVHRLSATMRAEPPTKVRLALVCTGVPREAPRPSRSQQLDVTPDWQRLAARFEVPEDWPSEQAYVEVVKPAGAVLSVDAVSLVVGERSDFSQTEAQSVGVAAAMPPGHLFVCGSPAVLPLEVVNASDADRDLRVDYRLEDWLGREIAAGQVFDGRIAPSGAAPAKVSIPTQNVGWFTLTFSVTQDGRLLSESRETVNVVAPMAQRGNALTSPIGMNTHMEREPNPHLDCNLSALSLCGVKWIRAWWGWGMAEKEPGKFDWTEYDRQFDEVHKAGMEIMPILLRYYPAYEQAWSGKTDKIQEPPYDVNQWGDFVRTTVERYQGRVKAWEVWNEPQYTMDAATYAPVLKMTYERVKAADPQALVVGFAGVSLDFIRQTFEAGGAGYLDVLSHHSYSQLGRPYEQMAKLAADTAALTRQYEISPPVWHTEQGSGADGVGYIHLPDTEEQCAVNLVQAYLSALGTGVEKFFWFSAQTSPTYGWGVFYEDYIPRPRLIALNGLARLLEGRKVTGCVDLCDGQVACVFLDGEAGPAAAVWNLSDALRLRLPTGGRVTATDMLGNGLGEADASSVLLEDGRPIYLTTTALSAKNLEDGLRRAEASPAGARFPLEAAALKTADGRLEVRVRNATGQNLDARVRVACPALFTAPPEAVQIADLPPRSTHTISLTPDRRPEAGAEVQVTVTLEVGDPALRQDVSVLTVRF